VSGSVSSRGGKAEALAATLGSWFREWAAAGIFCAIERKGSGRRSR
jgi:hypothetical protein